MTDETREGQHTGRIPGVTSEQWATLGSQLDAKFVKVIEEAKEDLKAHQGKQYGNTQWTFDFVKPRSRAIARWEMKLREEGQKAIEEMFPDVETPPVDLTCAVIALGDGENFTYTIRQRGAKPEQRGVSISSKLPWTDKNIPVAPV